MTFDEQLKRAFDALSERLHDEVARQVSAAAGSSPAASQSSDLAASERLLAAIRALDEARSLHDVLDTLASAARLEAPRVALVLVQGGAFRGWRFIGFGPAFDVAARIDISYADAGILVEALHTRTCVSADGGLAANGAPAFAMLPAGHECVAAPLTMGGDVVAALYADRGTSLSWPHTIEVLSRHAARCLEALTAIKAARALAERPQVPEPLDPQTDEGQISARRYARLLTSEIKLYHEADVVAGRRERDLATRLGGEIARARVLYEQRVPAGVRQGLDHFHAELVRTLADGDSSLLEMQKEEGRSQT